MNNKKQLTSWTIKELLFPLKKDASLRSDIKMCDKEINSFHMPCRNSSMISIVPSQANTPY